MELNHEANTLSSQMLREVSLLRRMRHKNIIRLLKVVGEDHCLNLVFELLDMSLQDLIHENHDKNERDKKNLKGKENETRRLAKKCLFQILHGLRYLHSHSIIHRDVTSTNILVDVQEENIKISDFGSAWESDLPTTNTGPTSVYTPPELVFNIGEYSFPGDIWSAGVIFSEFFLREAFNNEKDAAQALQQLQNLGKPKDWLALKEALPSISEFSEIKADLKGMMKNTFMCSQGFNLLMKMLVLNPDRRITAEDALKDPYFDDVEVC